MTDCTPSDFQYPSTRYSGSKRRLLGWIWENIKDIPFQKVLDVFGGTGSVSLLFKRYGKQVFYNDLLKFNQTIATAIIENECVLPTSDDIDLVLQSIPEAPADFIQREFHGIFYLDEENAWLDKVVSNIMEFDNIYKRSILLAGLFQACLVKRPFNLFHRANLNLRTASVQRSFGNKTTWEHPFDNLFRKYVMEYNKSVFSNGRKNKVVGGFDALAAPNGVDLVYLDPPYFSEYKSYGTNYLAFYHFLEGLADYKAWSTSSYLSGKAMKKFPDGREILNFTRKSEIHNSFTKLLERFQDNILVLSYQSDGVPSKEQIIEHMASIKKTVKVFEKPHRYALSGKTTSELLFIGT